LAFVDPLRFFDPVQDRSDLTVLVCGAEEPFRNGTALDASPALVLNARGAWPQTAGYFAMTHLAP
jgi:hypothetical protein